MFAFLARRLASIVPTLIVVSMLVFGLQLLLPGDPASMLAGEDRDEQSLAEIRAYYGLDRPIHEQYLRWIGGVLQGDFGTSLRIGQPVLELVLAKLPVTLQLGGMAFAIACLIGIPMGVLSAVRKDSAWDYAANAIALWGLSTPNFWLGIMLILLVSVELGWLPPSGYVSPFEDWKQSLATTIMPAFVLGNSIAAVFMRHTRAAMLQALNQDYVRTARAKGLTENKVLFKHVLRNAMIPIITNIGLALPSVFIGSFLIETFFSIPGLGREVLLAVNRSDYPVIQAITVYLAMLTMVINLLTDVMYKAIDPRVVLK